MASVMEKNDGKVVQEGKIEPRMPKKRFISTATAVDAVLKWNEDGDELIFEHDKGKFLELSEEHIAILSHANKVRYSVSLELSRHSDPEGDEMVRKFKVGDALDRRKQFEEVVKRTDQSARATKKLQAYVGAGFEPYWSRTDKIEERLEKGYEIVKPDDKTYAGVPATESHFETRVQQGQTELVLMKISKEKKAELNAKKQAAADRFDKGAERRGASELRQMGATLVDEQSGGAWQDRV